MNRLRDRRPGLRLVLATSWPEELAALFLHCTGRAVPSILRTASATDVVAALGARARLSAAPLATE
jgi:hypothetical protein